MTACEIHGEHRPKVLVLESHHLIPRAWQRVWRPERETRVLWAPRTIELCPSGHRNVHYILVRIMHAYADGGDLTRALALVRGDFGRLKEYGIAVDAPHQWISRGGSLNTLIEHRQFGHGLSFVGDPELRV